MRFPLIKLRASLARERSIASAGGGWRIRWRDRLINDEGEPLRVGRPGVHVDGALAAEELQQGLDLYFLGIGLLAGRGDYSHLDVVLAVVVLGAGLEREEKDILPVWGNVREPVFPFVVSDALGLGVLRPGAVGRHAPDVPTVVGGSQTVGVEVDPLAVGRVVGAVVIVAGVRQLFFLSVVRGNAVN